MKQGPCATCENKGCGAYHDVCLQFIEYKKVVEAQREFIYKQKEVNNLLYTRPVRRRKSAVGR